MAQGGRHGQEGGRMSGPTKISWADSTWSPIIGCSHYSIACEHCFAERMAVRLCGMGTRGYADVITDGRWNGKTVLIESELDKPLHWRKPRTIFVCSMSDLFHESVPFEWIDRIYAVMALCPQHRWMVLTKRVERMAEYLSGNRYGEWLGVEMESMGWTSRDDACNIGGVDQSTIPEDPTWPPANVWHGVTICNQAEADEKFNALCQIPDKLWVSYEPALGPVDFTPWLPSEYWCTCGYAGNQVEEICANCGGEFPRPGNEGSDVPCPCGCENCEDQCPECGLEVYRWADTRGTDSENAASEAALVMRAHRLSYIVAGGETGPGARPAHPDWFRKVRDDCAAAGVDFHFKQWFQMPAGQFNALPAGVKSALFDAGYNCNLRNAGRVLDRRTHDGRGEE
jgi:protein gp37